MLPVMALATAAASTYLARAWIEVQTDSQPQAAPIPPKPVTKSVLVAAKPLSIGEFVQPDGVRWQEWPDVALPDSYLVEGKRTVDDAAGAVVRRPVAEGEPIVDGNLVKPGDRGFLAAVLEPDRRAISVPVDEASSNAGLIFPGDRVDLILTQSVVEPGKSDEQHRASKTVLGNVRVLAMGRRLKGEGSEPTGSSQIRTVTLEVTPADAQKVALVTELGKLSLSLRSLVE
jgi:pilus assembly protein CpaB